MITGSNQGIALHPVACSLKSTDPQGLAITFKTIADTSSGWSIAGNSAILNPSVPSIYSLIVVAVNSAGATSDPEYWNVMVSANHPPIFSGDTTGLIQGTTSAISANGYAVRAQDADSDDVHFLTAPVGTPIVTDNTGAAVPGTSISIDAKTGVVTWTGTVPTGKTSVIAVFTVGAVDFLQGTTTQLTPNANAATEVVTLTYIKN